MNEQRNAMTWKDEIRATWEVSAMETITEAHPMNPGADELFRLRVLGTNTSHSLTSCGGRESIH
jgi:hypothetical protein